jgi:SAM-dependent methyltransferase
VTRAGVVVDGGSTDDSRTVIERHGDRHTVTSPGADTRYSTEFYRHQQDGSRRSAEAIAPLLLDLVRPRSVIDVGCGVGTWTAVFRALGVEDVHGVDGEWVDRALLQIPVERFLPADLTRPIALDRAFDLVVSLEVAEHLPETAADTFVDSLVRLGPVVAFSAAIPHQGGTHHVNEQWPSYWAARFGARGYVVIDAVRGLVWDRHDVDWYYAQNLLIYVRADALPRYPRLASLHARGGPGPLSVVHPRQYLLQLEWTRRLLAAIEDIATNVPADASLVMIDQGQCGPALAGGRRSVPFLERDGVYWGAPAGDAEAIAELERLREAGAGFVAIAWPAFWWLDHYAGLRGHLEARYACVTRTERVVVFDLFPTGGSGRPPGQADRLTGPDR